MHHQLPTAGHPTHRTLQWCPTPSSSTITTPPGIPSLDRGFSSVQAPRAVQKVHARHQHSILRPFKAYLAEEGVFELVLSLLELSSGSSGGGAAVLLLLCLLLFCKVQLDLHTYTEKAQKWIFRCTNTCQAARKRDSANCHAAVSWSVTGSTWELTCT